MLKPDRYGAKYVGVAAKQTFDAFALKGGGVSLSEHDRSRGFASGLEAVRFFPYFDVGWIIQDFPTLT